MYSWLPARADGDLLVEAIPEDAPARRLVRRVALDQRVEGALGVEGHRPHAPALRGIEPADVHLPRAIAERLQAEAGGQAPRGIDGADQHAPALERGAQGERGGGRRLADPARSRHDEDAALGPGRPAARGGERAHAASRRSASDLQRLAGELLVEEEGQRDDRRVDRLLQPLQVELRQLAAADVMARRDQGRGGGNAGGEAPGHVGRGEGQDLHLLRGGEPPLVAGVQDERAGLDPQLLRRAARELDGLDHRHLLGDGHHGEGGALGIAQQGQDAAGVVAHRAHGHGVGRGERHLQERQAVAGGRRVHDQQVVARPPRPAHPLLLEDHDLAEHHQLGQPGGGGEEAVVDGVVEDLPRDEVHPRRLAHVLVHDRARVEVDHEEAGEDLGLDVAQRRVRSQEARGRDRGVDLDQQDALAAVARGQGERGAHHALAHAALARQDHQPPAQQVVEQHPVSLTRGSRRTARGSGLEYAAAQARDGANSDLSAAGRRPASGKPFVVIVMPAYNAAKTLEDTFRRIPAGYYDEVIVVDDHSRDDTTALAQRLNLKAIRHPHNVGYGGNQKTCYMEALRDGADIVIMLHPDGQYDPAILPEMIRPIEEGRADMVLGSRMMVPAAPPAAGCRCGSGSPTGS